jgi:hypothetical protein
MNPLGGPLENPLERSLGSQPGKQLGWLTLPKGRVVPSSPGKGRIVPLKSGGAMGNVVTVLSLKKPESISPVAQANGSVDVERDHDQRHWC